jgi:AcrR family transcriptional regulator
MATTSEKLIQATERLLRRDGLARVTTREIAREAGVAEGALYHHFSDKAELLYAVVQQGMGDFREVLENLPFQVGQGSVRENLGHMLHAAFEFQFRVSPIVGSLLADHRLLARTREILRERCIGPRRSVDALASYLMAEQRLGRVTAEVAPQAAAELLLASGFQAAMFDHFLARDAGQEMVRQRINDTIQTLMRGLEPRSSSLPSVHQDRIAER